MSNKPNEYVFFLGGLDLEMLEIKKILQAHKLKVIDQNLSWGAKLSDYKKELDEKKTNVLIELEIDDKELLNSIPNIIIDHHNELSHKPSSLEQVIQLLQKKFKLTVDFTNYLKLVAINDVKHIKGLKDLKVPNEDIEKIRAKDRRAQGVTEIDEKLARESVENYKTDVGLVTVIEAQTNYFSPITDFVYDLKKEHLIVYNNRTLNYYGPAKARLVQYLNAKVAGDCLYHGGDENGFLGIAEDKFSPTRIKSLVTDLTNRLNKDLNLNQSLIADQQEIYSYHLFSFPFHFKAKGTDSPTFSWPLDQEGQETMTKNCAQELIETNLWTNEELKFSPQYVLDYNEQNYFYPFLYNSIYGNREESKSIQYLQMDLERQEHPYYIINCQEIDNGKTIEFTYKLKIDNVALQLYSTGVGVLMFYLGNYEQSQSAPDDILRINQFGRRLYPPFFGVTNKFEETEAYTDFDQGLNGYVKEDNTGKEKTISGVKHIEIAKSLHVLGVECTFDKYKTYTDGSDFLQQLPDFILNLFKDAKSKEIIKIKPVLDDRMFVLCWYGNSSISKAISESNDSYLNHDWWFNYVYIDNPGGKTCQNDGMASDLIKKATNPRWSNYGTLFGITEYSFMILSTDHNNLKEYGTDFLVNHLRTMYHKMVGLCLFQRASLLGFSEQLQNNSSGKYAHKNIRKIYKNYSLFINQHYFREITPQSQGVELYRRLQECFEIEREVNHIDREMNNFHDIVVLEESEASNENTERLNRIVVAITSFLIIPGFIVGFYGMNTFDNALSTYNKFHLAGIVALIFLSGLLAYGYFYKLLLSDKPCRWLKESHPVVVILISFLFFGTLCVIPLHCNKIQSTDSIYRGTIQPAKTDTDPSMNFQIVLPARTIQGKKDVFQLPADTLQFNLKNINQLPDSIILHQSPK